MTMFVGPEGFEDLTPSAGSRFGAAAGAGLAQGIPQGLSQGLQMLAKSKMERITERRKRIEEIGKIPHFTNSYLNDTGRKAYGTEVRDTINALAPKYIEQGYGGYEASQLATQEYESKQQPQENQSGFEILKNAIQSISKTAINPLSMLQGTGLAENIKKLPKALFEPKSSPELHKKAAEKSKTATSLNDFTQGELLSLKTEDIANLSPKLQEQYYKALPTLVKRAESISKAATVPFIGGAVEERAREAISPELPTPPAIATVARIVNEAPFLAALGTGSLLKTALTDVGVFGGLGALDETIRTLGTDKPFEFTPVIAQGIIAGLIPVGGAGLKKLGGLFRKATIQEMRATGKTAAQSAEEVLKRAKARKIPIEELKGKEQKTISTLSKSLNEDAEKTAAKIKSLKVERPEKPSVIEARKKAEVEAISKTPIQEYLEVKPATKGSLIRKAELEPKVEKNTQKINQLKKDLFKKEGTELQKAQKELQNIQQENYELNHEIKYGHKAPTNESITSQVEKSNQDLVNHILSPTEQSEKAILKNDKMMKGFINKSKSELVKGNIPEAKTQDLFININEAYLKSYKQMVEDIKGQMKEVGSPMRQLKIGEKLIENLENRIKGLDAAVKLQKQKRNVQSALKGPSGVFTRKLIDDVRGTQELFTKDLIRTGDRISHAERNISNATKQHFEEIGAKAVKGTEKEFQSSAEAAGFTKEESENLGDHIKKMREEVTGEKQAKTETKSEQKKKAKETKAEERKKAKEEKEQALKKAQEIEDKKLRNRIDKLLRPIRNQVMAGFVIGSLDELSREFTGHGISSKIKYIIYGSTGIPLGRNRKTHIPLAIAAAASDTITNKIRFEINKGLLHSKKGKQFLSQYEKVKKKGFTAKELKQIRENK